MLPLIAIGGAISAVASVIKGASWLHDKLGSSQAAGRAGAKSAAKSQASAAIAPFEAALAAQAAGQTLPGTAAGKSAAPFASVAPMHGTDYDTIARMQAGMFAYSHIGERHGNHAGAAGTSGVDDDKPITRS